jgi:hypothetical protein
MLAVPQFQAPDHQAWQAYYMDIPSEVRPEQLLYDLHQLGNFGLYWVPSGALL